MSLHALSAGGLAVSLLSFLGSPAGAFEHPASQLIAICASCHRLDNKPNGIPPIVGLGQAQIIAMMNGFRSRPQPNFIMHVVSGSLSAREVAAIAAYLADLEKEKAR